MNKTSLIKALSLLASHPTSRSTVISCCLLLAACPLYAASATYEKLNQMVQQAQAERANPEGGGAILSDIATNADSSDDEAPRKRPATLRDEAFKQLLDKISPLTPDQIIEMRKHEDKAQQAVATTPNAPPRPVSSTLTIDLSPGVTPPVIRLSAGFVTSLVFVDSTGQPWPIADYSLGNPKNFNIQWDKKTNTMFIQSVTAYSTANLAVRLATLDTPVMLSLVSGQREVDYRADLQVQGRGPNALAPVAGDNLPTGNPLLLSVLDGVPPPGSIELEVSGGLGRAWISKGRLIFRTQLTVLSPAWSSTVSSPDGTRVYEMCQTPLILVSKNGRPIKIELRGL
jgi:intracellular multiplication protein IcmK